MKSDHPVLLIVDDEPANLQKLRRTFVDGYEVVEAASGEEALEILRKRPVDAVVSDQRMPGLSGVELLRRTIEVQPDAVRVILTGYTEVEDLMDAINQGHVHRYLTKPWEPMSLRQVIAQELRGRQLELENRRLSDELKEANQRLSKENLSLRQEMKFLGEEVPELVFSSRAMGDLIQLLDRVVGTDSTVLIQGETGTGKELLARYIHRRSLRAEGALVPVNCGAIPADLVESAFFGHRKGAFTGATEDATGFFEMANGGTLFLDEVGEAPLDLQVKLLRVLQDGEIRPVGSSQSRKVDIRLIASTNRNLSDMVERGTFRQDLFFRLNVFAVLVPPLRARREDIIPLAQHFLGKFTRRLNKPAGPLEKGTLECLSTYDWPGNVRELENEIERLVILADSGVPVRESLLSERIRHPARASAGNALKEQLAALERELILDALDVHAHNKSRAAEALGITRQTIIAKLKQYRRR